MGDLIERLKAAKKTTPFTGKKPGTRYLVPEATIDEAASRIATLEAQLATAVGALEFYAQPVWSIDGSFPEASPLSIHRPDCGDTAREALSSIKDRP